MKWETLDRRRQLRRMAWVEKQHGHSLWRNVFSTSKNLQRRNCSCQYVQFENDYLYLFPKHFLLSTIELSWLSWSERRNYGNVNKDPEWILTIFALLVWKSFTSNQRHVKSIIGIFIVDAVSYSKSEYNNNSKIKVKEGSQAIVWHHVFIHRY